MAYEGKDKQEIGYQIDLLNDVGYIDARIIKGGQGVNYETAAFFFARKHRLSCHKAASKGPRSDMTKSSWAKCSGKCRSPKLQNVQTPAR
jgi:hypothetical protein